MATSSDMVALYADQTVRNRVEALITVEAFSILEAPRQEGESLLPREQAWAVLRDTSGLYVDWFARACAVDHSLADTYQANGQQASALSDEALAARIQEVWATLSGK